MIQAIVSGHERAATHQNTSHTTHHITDTMYYNTTIEKFTIRQTNQNRTALTQLHIIICKRKTKITRFFSIETSMVLQSWDGFQDLVLLRERGGEEVRGVWCDLKSQSGQRHTDSLCIYFLRSVLTVTERTMYFGSLRGSDCPNLTHLILSLPALPGPWKAC